MDPPKKVRPLEPDRSIHDPARRIGDELRDGERGDRLPASGLADEAEGLPPTDLEGHPVEGLDDAVVGEEVGPQILHVEDRAFHTLGELPGGGGFLREGNSTILIGTDEDKVDAALAVIQKTCRIREQLVSPLPPVVEPVDSYISYPVKVQVGGATVFVLDVERLVKI